MRRRASYCCTAHALRFEMRTPEYHILPQRTQPIVHALFNNTSTRALFHGSEKKPLRARLSIPIQTAKRSRPRAAARVGLLSFSPLLEGRRDAERRTLVTAAAYFPDCRETEAHGNASQRPAAASFRPRSVLPGTWLTTISRRCLSPSSHISGRAP